MIIEFILIKLTTLFLLVGVPLTILYNLFLQTTLKSKRRKIKGLHFMSRKEIKKLEKKVDREIAAEKQMWIDIKNYKINKDEYERVKEFELVEIDKDKLQAQILLESNRKDISKQIAILMKCNRLKREDILKIKDIIIEKNIRNLTCKNFKNDLHCIYSFIKNRSTQIDLLMIHNILSKIDIKSV